MALITRRAALVGGLSAFAASRASAMQPGLVPILLGGPKARKLLGAESAGLAISFVDGSMIIRDPTTPANNFSGQFSQKLAITGSVIKGGSGATVDVNNYATLATSLFPFSATAATLVVAGIAAGRTSDTVTTGTIDTYAELSQAAADTNIMIIGRHGFGDTPVDNEIVGLIKSANVAQTGGDTGIAVANSVAFKAAIAAAANDAAFAANGTVTTDASVTMPSSVDALTIGRRLNQSFDNAGKQILSLLYVPRRMTNAELQALTS